MDIMETFFILYRTKPTGIMT